MTSSVGIYGAPGTPVWRSEIDDLMRWFEFNHLPEMSPQRGISSKFAALATAINSNMPEATHQKVIALTYLLIAKDAAVRAAMMMLGTGDAPPSSG